MAINNQIVGGNFTDSQGNPLALGSLVFQLSQDEQSSTPGQVGAGSKITVALDNTGNVPASPATYLFANDSLNPANSFYTVWAYAANGQLVWGPQQQQILSSPSPFNLNAWVPNSISTGSTPAPIPTLQTNGVTNTVQSKLNLVQGTGISVTADSSGDVTISQVGVSAGLSIASNTNLASGITFSGGPTVSVNLTTEGTYDWGITTAAASSTQQLVYDPSIWRWKRSRGGVLIPGGGLKFGGTSDASFTGLTQGPVAFSANAGDDIGGALSGNTTTYPLANVRALTGLGQNVTTVVPTGYGFTLRIPLSVGIARTINLYAWVRSQVNKTATGTFTAHLQDGSAADVTTTIVSTSGAGGATFFVNKIVITCTPGTSTDLIITGILTATTGVTGVSGDGIGIQAITMS